MEPQNNTTQPATGAPKLGTIADLNRVTKLSKYLALVLFVSLPLITLYVGFSMGIAYQQKISAAADGQAVNLLLRELKARSGETGMEVVESPSEVVALPAELMLARPVIAARLGVSEDSVNILGFAEKEWPDGCLGLPEADEMCTQAIVPGYLVEVEGLGGPRTFRTDAMGTIVREEVVPGATVPEAAEEAVGAAEQAAE